MTTTHTHFTAWITSDPTCLAGDMVDVVVLADEEHGERGNGEPVWASAGGPLFVADTTVRHDDDADDQAAAEAEGLLEQAGWNIVGSWEAVGTGYIATVAPLAGRYTVEVSDDGHLWQMEKDEAHGVVSLDDGDPAAIAQSMLGDRLDDLRSIGVEPGYVRVTIRPGRQGGEGEPDAKPLAVAEHAPETATV